MNPPNTAWPACPPERLTPLIPERARKSGIETLEAYCDLIDVEATGHLTGVNAQRRNRRPRAFVDDRGEAVFLVPMSKAGTAWATVNAADWFRLQEDGANGLWSLVNKTSRQVRTYPAMIGPNRKHVRVGRLILGLGEGEVIRFLNRDPLDLRRSNLQAEPSGDPRPGNAKGPVRGGAARRNKARAEGRRFDPKVSEG